MNDTALNQWLKSGLALQPTSRLHIEILRCIQSPLMAIADLPNHGADKTAPELESMLPSERLSDATRECVYVLTTPFPKLKRMERVPRAELRATALANVPEFPSRQTMFAVLNIIGIRIGVALAEIAKHKPAH